MFACGESRLTFIKGIVIMIKLLDHKKSFRNQDILKQAKRCGCFYCLKIFNPEEITEWTDSSKGDEGLPKTAICPYCGIDSIIAEDSENKITPQNLKLAYDVYFGRVGRLHDEK